MIRLTKQTDYGIMVLTHFVIHGNGTPFTARDISKGTGLSLPMVSKVLKLLSRNDLLASHRGVKGGYTLTRSPAEVSVAEVINALEGPISMTECAEGPVHDCQLEAKCPVTLHWKAINETVRRALEGLMLSSMVGPVPSQVIHITRGM